MPEDCKLYAVEEVEDLLAEFNSPRNRLTVFKPFVRYFGDLNTAIILSEIFTWSYHFRDRKLPGIGYGWFYRQYEPSCKQQELDCASGVDVAADEMNATTCREAEGKTWLERVGLREDVVRKIVKILVKDGYVQTVVKKANGAPTCHYKFVRGKLLDLMDTLKKQERKPENFRERFPKKTGKETLKIRDSITEEKTEITQKTTTTQMLVLLSGTPLSKISEKELRVLIKRHGNVRVMQAADIAAETWRREGTEIRNPGGYLQALCDDLMIPEWYEPPHVRAAKSEAATERKRAEDEKQAELKKAEAQESKERDEYWHSLPEEVQMKFIEDEKNSSPIGEFIPEIGVVALAKSKAWGCRTQMITNTGLTGEPSN
ncbi:hypothetical protein [Geobacter benzoatilyticus]|uniref:Uncharacterized protein n=1 Tax=Geobacter benzoatilyticus TaxID=2815309 RepID=A0ABX7Q1M1_9BACT|nr:hypothetical protein [Geobacter benzoatilyticus]QSV44965.1 hypothetical protein JZM60_12515 [Geobacter benzoatilyticus]